MMNRRLIAPILVLVAVVSGHWSWGVEFDYYERLSSLVDTNNCGPPLTNTVLCLDDLRKKGDVAGVKLGTSIAAVVQLWGRPRSFYFTVNDGPLLHFKYAGVGFQGDKVVSISFSPDFIPGLLFEKGLCATNSPAQFAEALNLPVPGQNESLLKLNTESGVLTLLWNSDRRGLRLVTVRLETTEMYESRQPHPRGQRL